MYTLVKAESQETPQKTWTYYKVFSLQNFHYDTADHSEWVNGLPSNLREDASGDKVHITGNGALYERAGNDVHQTAVTFELTLDKAALTYVWSVSGRPTVTGSLASEVVQVA